uniref:IclR family transcriptional regulator domain-containing protein n=1 Tax=Halarchaeum sp. P4 TaxID=3421639 RepID=UPI003EB6AA54
PATITDEEELFAELERTRERGYAIDDEERLPGLRCVAAPVLGDAGGVLGAVSIAGPTNRFRGERFEVDLPERLLETVNIIELSGASLQRAP